MVRVDILVGNIAAGKSTYCKMFPDACIVSRDIIRKQLQPAGYLFDMRSEKYVHASADNLLLAAIAADVPHIIIDGTNMSKCRRIALIRTIDTSVDSWCVTNAVVFADRGREEHINARFANNHGDTSREEWAGVYDKYVKIYEAPSIDEGFNNILEV